MGKNHRVKVPEILPVKREDTEIREVSAGDDLLRSSGRIRWRNLSKSETEWQNDFRITACRTGRIRDLTGQSRGMTRGAIFAPYEEKATF